MKCWHYLLSCYSQSPYTVRMRSKEALIKLSSVIPSAKSRNLHLFFFN